MVESLPEKARMVVLLRYQEDLDPAGNCGDAGHAGQYREKSSAPLARAAARQVAGTGGVFVKDFEQELRSALRRDSGSAGFCGAGCWRGRPRWIRPSRRKAIGTDSGPEPSCRVGSGGGPCSRGRGSAGRDGIPAAEGSAGAGSPARTADCSGVTRAKLQQTRERIQRTTRHTL